MKESNTSERLKYIMETQCIKQVDILEKCKPFCAKYGVRLAKNDLSQYVSGKVEPKQDKLSILGLALNVSEAWLSGYNVPMSRSNTREFKDIIKQLRTEKNLSQSDLASELEISSSSVAMWEIGRRYPSKELYEQIADYFNVDIDFLYGRTDIRQKIHFDKEGHAIINTSHPSDFLINLNDEEKEIIIEYRSLDEENQKTFRRLLEYATKFQELYEKGTKD